ncbi:hypothetical protein SAMN06265218_12026 [Fodinibius sediminis]|uniref:Uncharacterized protein n=1 Tax=Fodinibius sediminis TaxID=1214077 RepID=A0A521F043_9BACT|nr:hypothetical protein SAMN06265218_12026 [Fodinibius sediminis]
MFTHNVLNLEYLRKKNEMEFTIKGNIRVIREY